MIFDKEEAIKFANFIEMILNYSCCDGIFLNVFANT